MPENKEVKLRETTKAYTPNLPNFIKVGTEFRDIAGFSEPDLRAIGKAWTEALVEKAARRAGTRRDSDG